MAPRKPIRVPRYLVPLARKIRDIERIIHKGLIVDSPDTRGLRQSDGRVQLKVK